MQAAIDDFSAIQITSAIPVLQEVLRLFEIQDLCADECDVDALSFEWLLQQATSCE